MTDQQRWALMKLAAFFLHHGRHDEAQTLFAVVADETDDAFAWYGLGEVARTTGDRDEAARCFAAAAERGDDPRFVRALETVGHRESARDEKS